MLGLITASDVTYPAINCRKHTAFLTDFGGVGDGKTPNTAVFQAAVSNLSQFGNDGGSQLIVPPGKWLTGSFNLTSHFTLFIQFGAVVLASQDEGDYPLVEPLPSYGSGRDGPGGRFSSLIGGSHLTDVVITGDNGTIDGQGSIWWDKFHKKELKNTRPYLIEPIYSNQIQISNLTLINSPSWFVHLVYSSDIIIQGLTILAPVDAPNTDGINPARTSMVNWDCRVDMLFSKDSFQILLLNWGVCKILAMIAMLPLVKLFFFHILLIQKGISTCDYIISLREQGQGISGQQSPQMSPASSFNNFRQGSWCTPPRLFIEDQCPTQPGSSECGYYVLNFMKEVVREGIQILVNDNVGGGKGIYTETDLDTVREEWSSYPSQFIFR